MYTNGVDILHTADGDCVVGRVTHNLELDLLISLYALLDKNLMHGRELKCVDTDLAELLLVVSKAATCTAKGKCRTENYGIADASRSSLCLLKIIGDLGGDSGLTDRLAELLEHLSVLCSLDRLGACTEKSCAALLKNTLLLKLHSKVKSCLSADTGENCIRTLVTEDLCNVLKGEGLHINLVRDGGIGHNGSRVGVNKNYLVALLLQCKAGLCARIIKLCSLSDNDRTRADYHYSLNICSLCHLFILRVIKI